MTIQSRRVLIDNPFCWRKSMTENVMKIGIIDADLLDNGTRHPNLALMKLSSHYKHLGCRVELLEDYVELESFDKIFISRVFSFTKVPDWIYSKENIEIGGTGFFPDGGKPLPEVIEHSMPDYSLYNSYVQKRIEKGEPRQRYVDYLDFSIGFTTRGCFRKCDFCVNKKYDHAFKHSPISEFFDPQRKFIYLWDDNFFASKDWKEILNELKGTNRAFQFRQGLDIRLLNEEKAIALSEIKYHGDFIFAFDHVEDKHLITEKLTLWRTHSKKPTKLYVLVAYDSQDENDIENAFIRIKILMEYNCLPYVMRYEEYKNSKFQSLYIQIARWTNQPKFFKKMSFREFCVANQKYAKNQTQSCACFRAFQDFEKEYPEIASKYFDMKFEVINRY